MPYAFKDYKRRIQNEKNPQKDFPPAFVEQDNQTLYEWVDDICAFAGEKEVTYRSYVHIPYVTKPEDADYQICGFDAKHNRKSLD